MVFDPLTAAVTVATLVLTEAVKVPGKKLGEVSLEKAGTLMTLIKSKVTGKPLAIAPSPDQSVDIGQVFLEVSEAAHSHPDVAQAVQELAAAVQQDDSEMAQQIQNQAKAYEAQAPTVINNEKLADSIKNLFQGNIINNPTFN
jgi:ribulose kinase